MNLFICWSGAWGKNAAPQIKEWLCDDVLKTVRKDFGRVFVSENIAKGAMWFEQLSTYITQSCAVLVCLTPDALRSPWVHYEVGAIANALRKQRGRANGGTPLGPVYTLLLGVKAGDLEGPLAAFQSTSAYDQQDMRQLIDELTGALRAGRKTTRWQKGLNQRWPETWDKLRDRLQKIAIPFRGEVFPDFEHLFRRKTFQEPTLQCVNQKWQERYDGARDTWAKLREHEGTVQHACRPYIADMYKALIAMVDQYAMGVSLLLGAKKFDLDKRGYVKIEDRGLAQACERSRKRIMSLVARLTDPCLAPRFEEVFRFEAAETISEKKSLIHRRTPDINKAAKGILKDKNERWQASDWDYDRIIYSLCLEKHIKAYTANKADRRKALSVTLDRAMTELQRACSLGELDAFADDSRLMSLSYALVPLECAPRGTKFKRRGDLRYLVRATRELLQPEQRALAAPQADRVAPTYGGFEAAIEDSLKRIERVFGLRSKDAPRERMIPAASATVPVNTNRASGL